MMRSLEPRQEPPNTMLFHELEDVNEVIFINKGIYEIGYEFNGYQHYKIRYKNTNLIGAYNIIYNQKTQFLYKTFTRCRGFFIRKRPWEEIMESHQQVTDEFKASIANWYDIQVRGRLNFYKRKDIKRLSNRRDVHHYKFVVDVDQMTPMFGQNSLFAPPNDGKPQP